MKRVICWWFGCRPQYEPDRDGFSCSRCGAWDVRYSDLVGDTRHNRMIEHLMDFMKRFIRQRPKYQQQCDMCGKVFDKQCGSRVTSCEDCIPF